MMQVQPRLYIVKRDVIPGSPLLSIHSPRDQVVNENMPPVMLRQYVVKVNEADHTSVIRAWRRVKGGASLCGALSASSTVTYRTRLSRF